MSTEHTTEDLDAYEGFIRCCLAAHWDANALEIARAIVAIPGFDWRVCREQLVATGTAPLVYQVLKETDLLPHEIGGELKQIQEEVRLRNTVLYIELKDCLAELQAQQIPVVLLKGAALVKVVYGDVSLRPCIDADLLVPREQIGAAVETVQRLGFQIASHQVLGQHSGEFENEVQLVKRFLFPVMVELHWSLFDSPYYQEGLDLTWYWSTARGIDFYGTPAQILCPEAQLLHLCGHLLLHHTGRELLWLNDIARVLVHYQDQISWDVVLERAQADDLLLPLQGVLPRLRSEWHVPIPNGFLKRLAMLKASPEERRVFAQMTTQDSSASQRLLDDLSGLPGWRLRLRFALFNLFPSFTYMQARYRIPHPLLVPLYYPYRWYLGLRGLLR